VTPYIEHTFAFYRKRGLIVKENLPVSGSNLAEPPIPKREGLEFWRGDGTAIRPGVVGFRFPSFLAVSRLSLCLFVEDSVDVPFAVKDSDNINSEWNDLVEDQHLFETGDRPLAH